MKLSDEAKAKQREYMRKKLADPAYRTMHNERQRLRWRERYRNDAEFRAKQQEYQRQRYADPENRERRRADARKRQLWRYHNDAAYRERCKRNSGEQRRMAKAITRGDI